MKGRIYLTADQAISILPNDEQIHTFYNPGFGLVGADWGKDDLIEKIRGSEYLELTGEQAKSMKHGLCAYRKNARQGDILFIETDMESLEKLEMNLFEERKTKMKDIKLLEKCPQCGEPLTLMGSIRMGRPDEKDELEGSEWLVKRCLNCGGYPVEEVVMINTKITGETSDGYHTFDELYYHRMVLFSIICRVFSDKAWKSWKHSDGTMFDNHFIVGITTPEGDYTYHYGKDFWGCFPVRELANAPEYDGHKPGDIGRLLSLLGHDLDLTI